MEVKAFKCPNCGGPYNPAKRCCEYCGSFIIMTDLKEENYSKDFFESNKKTDAYRGIYIYGLLLDRDEYPVRMGLANHYKSAMNSAGGHLLLTNKRLYFLSHATNIGGVTSFEIKKDDITKAEQTSNLMISQKIAITDKCKKKTTFVVYGGPVWVTKINDVMHENCNPMDIPLHSTAQVQVVNNSKLTKPASYTDEIIELKKLLDAGVITQEDFDLKKRMILGI